MRRWVGVLVGLVAAAFGAVAAACGSFGSDDTSTPSLDAGNADASLDASAVDAGRDGEVDPPPLACPTDAFCSSFEDADLAKGWTTIATEGGGQVVQGSGRGGGHSFRSVIPQSDETVRRAQLLKTFGNVSSLACTFWVRIEQANDDTDVFKVELGNNSEFWLDSKLTATALCPPCDPLRNLESSWQQVAFTLTPNGQGVDFKLRYGADPVASENLPLADLTNVIVRFGGEVTAINDGSIIEYDDLVCTTP